uniref:Uncharacterized protein n=1 Tax=Molossus molossus TaxID=27622 RepID=A0A7J8CRX6_MOLMO|nr:hypothetical protein HJG59_009820 [Molossus molossus]
MQASPRDPGLGQAPKQSSWQLFGALAEAASVPQGAFGAFSLNQSPCCRGHRLPCADGPQPASQLGDCEHRGVSGQEMYRPGIFSKSGDGAADTRSHAKDSPTEDEQGSLEDQQRHAAGGPCCACTARPSRTKGDALFLSHLGVSVAAAWPASCPIRNRRPAHTWGLLRVSATLVHSATAGPKDTAFFKKSSPKDIFLFIFR